MPSAHTAVAEHRVELVERLNPAACTCIDAHAEVSATWAIALASSWGRNSCSGGSSRRIVTGKPASP